MKYIIKLVILFALGMSFIYSLFSFFFMSFNPIIWGEGGRYFFASFAFLGAFATIAFGSINNTK